jgi:chloramphenicol-sensitive protein RarD
MNRGILYALLAYLLWGVLPIYWKSIQNIPALEIIAHRVVWAFFFVFVVAWVKGDWQHLKAALKNGKVLFPFLATGILLFINWLVYIWAVNAGYIVDASLGYFITPLVNVLLGVIFLKERLRQKQWIAVVIATAGVIYLTISYGVLPWIGLTLAFTFGLYGLLKKTGPLNSIQGFTLETGFLFLPALVYLILLEINGTGAFPRGPISGNFLLVLTGVATGLPLILFGAAAHRVPLSTLGFIQYIAPTLQFIIGVLIYGEAFTPNRMIGFGLIWVALAVYSLDGVQSYRTEASSTKIRK